MFFLTCVSPRSSTLFFAPPLPFCSMPPRHSKDAGLDFCEFVMTVWRTKDTVFSCDMQTIGPTLWRLIDADGERRGAWLGPQRVARPLLSN